MDDACLSLRQEAVDVLKHAECLFSESLVSETLDAMAVQISETYQDKNPVVLCVMKGGLYISSELMTRFNFPLQLDYIHVTRYKDGLEGDALQWLVEPQINLRGRHVLILDDILDQGITMRGIQNFCKDSGCTSVAAAVLVQKNHNDKTFKVAAQVEYIGLNVPDRYVFGSGMDYKSYHRNLMGIYAVAE